MIKVIFFNILFLTLADHSVAASKVLVDTLYKTGSNCYSKQLDESVIKIYVNNNYVFFAEVGIQGTCRIRGGIYSLFNNVFVVYNDSNSLCQINNYNDIAMESSKKILVFDFSGISLRFLDNERIELSRYSNQSLLNSVHEELLTNQKEADITMQMVYKSDSVLFPFSCGLILHNSNSDFDEKVIIQVNNIYMYLYGFNKLTHRSRLILKDEPIGTVSKSFRVIVFQPFKD